MHKGNVTLVLAALLSSGMVMAQAPANPNGNADTSLAAQSAPATSPAVQDSQEKGRGRHHAMNPDKQAKHLAKKLKLSKDQVQQIKPILADRQQQMESLRGDASLQPQDRREKMRAIQQDSKTKIEAVLNDAQKQQFEQMMASRRAHRKGGEAAPATQPGV